MFTESRDSWRIPDGHTALTEYTLEKLYYFWKINTVHKYKRQWLLPGEHIVQYLQNVNVSWTKDGCFIFSSTINSFRPDTIFCHVTSTWSLCISAFLYSYWTLLSYRLSFLKVTYAMIWLSVLTWLGLTIMKSSLVKLPSPQLGQLGLWSLSEPGPSACSELSGFHSWWREPT